MQACGHSPFRNSTAHRSYQPRPPPLLWAVSSSEAFLPLRLRLPQPWPPCSFTIPEMGQGPAHCSSVAESSWLSAQLWSCPVPKPFSLRRCTIARSVPALENCTVLPPSRLGPLQFFTHVHTHTPGDGPGLALPPVPQGLGLDLTS